MKYNFTYDTSSLIITLDTENGKYKQDVMSINDPSIVLDDNSISIYDSGVFKNDFRFLHIGTIDGQTPSDVIDASNKIQTIINQLYTIKASTNGGVPSVIDLVSITSPINNMLVFVKSYYSGGLSGGGFFVCRSGAFTADGGHVFESSDPALYWERLSDDVDLSHYGIKIQSVSVAVGASSVDYYSKLNAAIQRAKSINKPLVSNFPMFNDEHTPNSSGVYISQGLDITGLKILNGNLTIFVKGSTFTPIIDPGTATEWVLINKNASYDVDGKQSYGSTYGRQTIGSISIINLESRTSNVNLNGQLHTTAHSNFYGTLSAYKMGGTGVWLASTYDSSFNDIKVNQCGSTSKFAFDTNGYVPFTNSKDETNACTINNIMVHDANDYSLQLRGAKNAFIRIHEENTKVSTNNGGTPIYSSPYGYYNAYVDMAGGFIGQWQSDTSGNGNTNAFPSVSVIVMDNTSIGTLFTHERIVIHTTSNPPNTYGGHISTINCNELYIVGNAKASIGNCRITAKTKTNYSLPGKVTIIDTTSSIDILQYEDVAVCSGGTYNKITGGNLTLNNCSAVSVNVLALTISGDNSSIDKAIATSLNINGGSIGHAKITDNATVSRGVVSKLMCSTLTHTGGLVSSGSSSGNITSSGGSINNFASQGSATISGEGTYNRLTLDNLSNGVLTITGSPFLINCSSSSNVLISNTSGLPAKIDRFYTGGTLTCNDGSKLHLENSVVYGQLNLAGLIIEFQARNSTFGNMSTYGASTGWWVFINCKWTATAGNWKWGTDLTKPIGMMSQQPVTNEMFICTSTGWKQITHA